MLQKRKFFHSFQSKSYNNVVVTKQIHFSSIILKAWAHISDNIARVVVGLHAIIGSIYTDSPLPSNI